MKKLIIAVIILISFSNVLCQINKNAQKIEVMTLGVFHFSFRNLDVTKTLDDKKINVLDQKFQNEIIAINKAITEFNPTIIAVEALPKEQNNIDSLYKKYKNGNYNLGREEIEQIGFRLGKHLNLERIHCTNNMGKHYSELKTLFNNQKRLKDFEHYYLNNPDSLYWKAVRKSGQKVESIIDKLIELNNPKRLKERLGIYLLTPFKYEEHERDFTGVDFETGRWFNRNLRIFRNIQRIPQNIDDRILVIYGAEHLNLLNIFFDSSFEYDLVKTIPYLEKAKSRIN